METRNEIKVQADRVISTLLTDLSGVIREEREICLEEMKSEQQAIETLTQMVIEKINKLNCHFEEIEVSTATRYLEGLFGLTIWNREDLLAQDSKTLLIRGKSYSKT